MRFSPSPDASSDFQYNNEQYLLTSLIERVDRLTAALHVNSSELKQKYEDSTAEAFGTLAATELDQVYRKKGVFAARKVKGEIYRLLVEVRRD